MSGLTFDRDTHTYCLDGHVIPHVTQVTDTLCSYAGVPWDVLERKREIGEAVHYATELDDAGDLDDASLPDEIRGYVEAWRKFKRETGFIVGVAEMRVHSTRFRFAGTLDRIGTFEQLKHVKPTMRCLIDLKTTYAILPAVGPQTAAYAQAYNETFPDGARINKRCAVQLKTDGTYNLHDCADVSDWNVFISALNLLNWKQRHNIEVPA